MSWVDEKAKYQAIASSFDFSAKVVVKEGWFWKTLAVCVAIVTFGGVGYRKFLTEFATTLGPLMAYPLGWDKLSTSLLVHEARHVRHARWFGLWTHPWVGAPLYWILYLLVFLPLGMAWFRYRLELDADAVSWKWMIQNGSSLEQVRLRSQQFGVLVASGSYGWPWPKSWVLRGFSTKVDSVIRDYLNGVGR